MKWLIICAFLGALSILVVVMQERKKRATLAALPEVLGSQELAGRDLCKALETKGIRMSYGTFYSIMRDAAEKKIVTRREGKDQWGKVAYFRLSRPL